MNLSRTQTGDISFYSPRPYLSWSQIQLFERSPDLYVKKYIYGEDDPTTEAMRLGKSLAQALEMQKETGDDVLDNLLAVLPSYPQREFKIEAALEGLEVPLYGVLDGFDEKRLRIGEYKSGRLWNQEMVNESGQLKMYALMIWLKYKKIPSEVMLHWAKTQYNEGGELEFAGEIKSFMADISLEDVLLFSGRVRKAWVDIKEISERHYKAK
ncbi:MAG: PD-(D/E)XK nuclease family protein [Acidobacteria bacterium]|nr:PD-(D/E)XK nuclease family protein [Acidobacteriota bacterium]